MKQLPGWLQRDELQFISVCDPNKESYDYPLWGRSHKEQQGAPGGRKISRNRIDKFYAEKSGKSSYKGVSTYADFSEQLEKEQSLDSIFIMTPDHLHGTIIQAGMNKKLSVATHKPIGNFMNET
ncbi:MAG: Gfo/Idh/MocA family oxidoreductase [Clostridiales bacterium]|nr:Gfo/Idh/MocA family oxidoreductase [Clostridiales bacterium]